MSEGGQDPKDRLNSLAIPLKHCSQRCRQTRIKSCPTGVANSIFNPGPDATCREHATRLKHAEILTGDWDWQVEMFGDRRNRLWRTLE